MRSMTRRGGLVAAATAGVAVLGHSVSAQTATDDQVGPTASALPEDDPRRALILANPDSGQRPSVAIAGGTYTILLTGQETGGRYSLIDMHVPPGAGPPPHRHDFEEMFSVLEGEVAFTFRGASSTAVAGETVNIPANAPHAFTNRSGTAARLLCMCTPPGQEEFFLAIGDPVSGRTQPGPALSPAEQADRLARTRRLAPRFRTELLSSEARDR